MTATVEQRLSELVIDSADADIPDEARAAALRQVVDCLGVTIAASGEAAGASVESVIRRLGGEPQARVIGLGLPTNIVQAAWANGGLAHLMDYDDIGFSHPSACILPAALAIAEEKDLGGRELIAACVLGYEVFERLASSARADDARVRFAGYHPTSIYGAVAAAAAASRLLGLDVGRTVVALGIAAADASGLTQQFGTWAKGLNAANAARSGVLAALISEAGYDADEQGVSGRYGLFSAVHGEGRYDLEMGLADLGDRWCIVDPGLGLKYYPICGSNRKAVDAVHVIQERLPGYDPGDVAKIVVHVHPDVFHTLRHRAPTEGFRGKFSLDYTVATIALDGTIGIDSFTDDAARRPALRAMLDKVELAEHPEWSMDIRREMPVEIHFADGRVEKAQTAHPRGTPGWPLTDEEYEHKFLTCATRVLGKDRAGVAFEQSMGLGEAPRVRAVVDTLCR